MYQAIRGVGEDFVFFKVQAALSKAAESWGQHFMEV